jgi:spore germination protein YaaH
LSYVVQPGDSLWSIAARFGVSVQAIAAANHLASQQMLHVGQTLIIPTAPSSTQPGYPVPAPQSPSNSSLEVRVAKLEREFDQIVTIVDDHRRQIFELSRRIQRIEKPTS